MIHDDIPKKANHILHIFILALLLIGIRIWYLATVEHEQHLALARKPQRHTVAEKASRGTITDRFGIPLAVNKIQYNAAICYNQIRDIPRITWKNKQKIYERKEYIFRLSLLLGNKFDLNPIDIEDIIYSKASIFPNTPFILKEEISEREYYELKMLERNWPGILAERSTTRDYPQGKLAGDLIGYLGAINQKEYLEIAHEITDLSEYLEKKDAGLPCPLPYSFLSSRHVYKRLQELKEKAYRINDFVGKAGIEKQFDESLRGVYGSKKFELGSGGHFIRELPGSHSPISGQQFKLSISSELQDLAEKLLTINEMNREEHFATAGKNHSNITSPWIKGGAIVAMIPDTGEVVAMATYPRYDPNDFILSGENKTKEEKRFAMTKWLENELYISQIWDGIRHLEREGYSEKNQQYITESKELNWDEYLDQVLSKNGAVRQGIDKLNNIDNSFLLQQVCEMLLMLSTQESMPAVIDTLYPQSPSCFQTSSEIKENITQAFAGHQRLSQELKSEADRYFTEIPFNDDKLLLLDLSRLALDKDLFKEEVFQKVKHHSLANYRKLSQAKVAVEIEVQSQVCTLFHMIEFPHWRKEYFKHYLTKKRALEKVTGTYAHPYIDYLKEAENKLFTDFWNKHKWNCMRAYLSSNANFCTDESLKPFLFHLIRNQQALEQNPDSTLMKHVKLLNTYLEDLSPEFASEYLQTMRSFNELNKPLLGHYSHVRNLQGIQYEQHLASAFYPTNRLGYGRSFAFRQATLLGSIFKIITGYEALRQTYEQSKNNPYITDMNPMTIIDETSSYSNVSNQTILGYTMDRKPIYRRYKGGQLPRTHARLGKIDFLTAVECSSNIYFSLLASDVLDNPLDLHEASQLFGFGSKTGIDLPYEYKGLLPYDLRENRTGLYSFAIGQHTLVVTPLQTAIMLSTIANKGDVLKPQIVHEIHGVTLSNTETIFSKQESPYNEYYQGIGIDFPLFTADQKRNPSPHITQVKKQIKRSISMPEKVREYLLTGLNRVVWSERGGARATRIRGLFGKSQKTRDYYSLKEQMVGKTSTAERVYRPFLDREGQSTICKDIWFGSVTFQKEEIQTFEHPELVVVVYLKYGDYGKEAAPLAAEIVKKWRQIVKNIAEPSQVK